MCKGVFAIDLNIQFHTCGEFTQGSQPKTSQTIIETESDWLNSFPNPSHSATGINPKLMLAIR